MPTKPKRRCTQCKRLHAGTGKCPDCKRAQERELDAKRGSAASRGYDQEHRTRFRAGVLERNPYCVLCLEEDERIVAATIADHHPHSRRELVALGLDPNDPRHGRGLCKRHHDRETAKNQPGGWNRR